jgi:glycosidase
MGVMLQAFYWDCPQAENRDHQWWSFIKSKLPAIAQAGFTALWLPPANKAASWKSMGYDPYDYYDLGEFDAEKHDVRARDRLNGQISFLLLIPHCLRHLTKQH